MIGNYRFGILLALMAAICWGATGPVSRMIALGGVSMITVMVYRTIAVTATVGLFLSLREGMRAFAVSRRMLRIYGLLSFLTIGCMGTGYLMSCAYLTVPQAVLLHFTYPLVTIAAEFVFLGQRPGLMQVGASMLILVGLYVAFGLTGSMSDLNAIGVLWGILSITGLCAQALVSRVVLGSGEAKPITQLFFTHLFGGVFLIVCNSLFGSWADLANVTTRLFGLMQYNAFGSGLAGFAFLYYSYKYIPASMAGLVCTMEMVFSLAFMYPLMGEVPTSHEIAGGAIIFASVLAATLLKPAQHKEK